MRAELTVTSMEPGEMEKVDGETFFYYSRMPLHYILHKLGFGKELSNGF